MWQTPKTSRGPSEYFNAGDYNRIANNMLALQEMAAEVCKDFYLESMGQKVVGGDIYADEINIFERNLATICTHLYPFTGCEQKTFYPNQPATGYAEYNRIETLLLERYELLQGQINGRKTLSFVLGGGEF